MSGRDVKRHGQTSSPMRVIIADECHRGIRLLPAYRTHRRRRPRNDTVDSLMTRDLSTHVSHICIHHRPAIVTDSYDIFNIVTHMSSSNLVTLVQ